MEHIKPGTTVQVKGHAGMAFYFIKLETEPDEDTDWSGYEAPTGKAIVCMVGDDYKWSVDPEDISPLDDEDFCHGCGSMDCGHQGQWPGGGASPRL